MKIEIDVPDRLYSEIRELCEYNNQQIDRYVIDCISDTYYTLKYGDLNLKLNPNKEDLNEKIVEKKATDAPKKKVGRPRKKVADVVPTDTKETVLKKEDTVTVVDEQLQNKITRTKRTLKVK